MIMQGKHTAMDRTDRQQKIKNKETPDNIFDNNYDINQISKTVN